MTTSIRPILQSVGVVAAAIGVVLLGDLFDQGLYAKSTLIWPTAGLALVLMRLGPRRVVVGLGIGTLLVNAPLWSDAVTQAISLGTAVGATQWMLRRAGTPRPLLNCPQHLNNFLVALAFGAVLGAMVTGVGAAIGGASATTALASALYFGTRQAASVALIAAPIFYFSDQRIRPAALWRALALGLLSPVAGACLRIDVAQLVFLAFLILPAFVWIAIRDRVPATMASMASVAISLGAFGLLVPDFHPSPVRAISFAWVVAACTGLTLLALAASLTQTDLERKRQRETLQQLSMALAATEDRIWDWDVVANTIVVESATLDDPDHNLKMGLDNWLSEVHPEDVEALAAQHDAIAAGTATTIDCEYRVASQDLTWRWLLTRGSVVESGASGAPKRVIGTSRDISTQREALRDRNVLEQRMAQSQRLESLGVLAGGVAHDFNNLLLAILNNVEIALEDYGQDVGLLEAKSASLRARDLCLQLLAYAGQRPTELVPSQMHRISASLHGLMRASIPEHIQLDVALDDAPAVLADPGQLGQVLLNLVINAAEALGSSMGTIAVEGGATTVDLEDPTLLGALTTEDVAYFEVRDDGPGMDAYVLDRLFDPFFTTKFQGRGLGMAAVLGIVRAHHGAIQVFSRRNRGTRVRVYLAKSAAPQLEDAAPVVDLMPEALLAATRALTDAPPPPVAPAAFRGQVIVADDEPAIRRTLSRALARRGFEVVLCEDGQQALDAVQAHADTCRLVIMDVVMPKMTGRDALPQIRAAAPELNVILMSGYDADVDSPTGDYICTYLQKPFSLQSLDAALAVVAPPA